MAWLTNWDYRKSKHIDGSVGGDQSDYQMINLILHYGSGTDDNTNVYLNSHCRTDFGDVRFTASDGQSLFSYWISAKVDSDYCEVNAKIILIPSAGIDIYIYYGKTDATSASNFYNTFIFGELWDEASLNSGRWPAVTGNPVYTINTGSHYLEITDCDIGWDSKFGFRSKNITFPVGYKIEGIRQPTIKLYTYIHTPKPWADREKIFFTAMRTADLYRVAFNGLYFLSPKTWYNAGVGNNVDWSYGKSATGVYGWWTITKWNGIITIREGTGETIRVQEANSDVPDKLFIELGKWPGKNFGTVRVNRFRVRKFVDPEPVWSTTGGEEPVGGPVAIAIQCEGQTNPISVSDNKPELSAEYDNPVGTDVASSHQVQVIIDGGTFSSPLWDSGKIACSVLEGTRLEIEYGGSALVFDGSKYYQRWKFWDSGDVASEWSNGTDYWIMEEAPDDWRIIKLALRNSALQTQIEVITP